MTSPLHAPLAASIGDLTPLALGAAWSATALELGPFGHAVRFVDALASPAWVDLYHRSNLHAFAGPTQLPGWVLVDMLLLPSAIGLLACKASSLSVAAREALRLSPDDDAIAAAYAAIPCAEPGTVMGVSLFSLAASRGAARAVKTLTLGMMGARRQRGIAQWSSGSLRVHTRMGPLRLLGPAPPPHENAADSFVYEVDLGDHRIWADHLAGAAAVRPSVTVPVSDLRRLSTMAERAYHGDPVEIVPPGLSPDGTHVYVSRESERR